MSYGNPWRSTTGSAEGSPASMYEMDSSPASMVLSGVGKEGMGIEAPWSGAAPRRSDRGSCGVVNYDRAGDGVVTDVGDSSA
jgi:hypothetical protein